MNKQRFSLFCLIISLSIIPLTAQEISSEVSPESIELISAPDHDAIQESTLPLEELRLFTEVLELLKNHYVDPVSDQTLIQNAIKGMIALDPHSKYYSKEAYQQLKNETSGSFSGIGVASYYDDETSSLIIDKIFPNSPASKADLKVGDGIQKINGIAVKNIDASKRESSLQGDIESEVSLTIIRENQEFDLSLIRAKIQTQSLSIAHLYHDGLAYFKLDRFQEKSDEEILNALMTLEIEAQTQNTHIRGAILDLRDNRGGLLNAAIAVADLFLDEGLITYTDGQSERFKTRYEAKKGEIIPNIPLIVLLNAQSASGAEIVAGALQDHQRAIIVGENSYGKGSIQMVQPLKNGDAVRYTSARYYTPNGHSIQNRGITPDLILPHIEAKIIQHYEPREIDNEGHLDNLPQQKLDQRIPANFSELIEQGDFLLYEALNILKAMSLQ